MSGRFAMRVLCCALVLLYAVLQSFVLWAQEHALQPGQRIEYKASSYPETWLPGTIVRVMPQYQQVLVRWDPRDDYPGYTHDGVSTYEQGYAVADVRPLGTAPANSARPAAAAAVPPAAAKTAMPPADVGTGGAPLAPQELIAYMRAHAYRAGQPTRDANVCRTLIAQIKARGVVEPLEVGKDDLGAFAENGCYSAQDTDVVAASRSNIGAPVGTGWLAGTWVMYVIGGTVDTLHNDGWVYRQNESIAKLGFLKIDMNGSYVWKIEPSDPPEKYVTGRWRAATPVEMQLQGGAGIVLQRAAEGADWIVFKYMDAFNKAERVEVEHLQSRGAYRRIGWRS